MNTRESTIFKFALLGSSFLALLGSSFLALLGMEKIAEEMCSLPYDLRSRFKSWREEIQLRSDYDTPEEKYRMYAFGVDDQFRICTLLLFGSSPQDCRVKLIIEVRHCLTNFEDQDEL